MNVFIIPSWYPSKSNPIYGIFNKEQAIMMASERPEWNVGVSTWGQGDEDFLIYSTRFSSFSKLKRDHSPYQKTLKPNLTEYFRPAYTWTRKWRNGNLVDITQANEENLLKFQSDYGTPDIISAQASYPGAYIAYRLSQKYQIPYFVTLRMGPFPFKEFLASKRKLSHFIDRPLKNSSTIIATSNAQKSMALPFGLQNIEVIHDSIDTNFFSRTDKSTEKLKLLMISRIEDKKGIDLLLEATSQIDVDFELRIGGEGSMKAKYMALSKKLFGQRGSERVKWLGELSRDQVKKEMQSCSFYILPSLLETFGIVLIEAMSCGKPVVATRCGGPQEIVDKHTGILCDINVESLKKSILEMIDTFDSYNPVEIRTYAIQKFSSMTWIEKIEKVFKSVSGKQIY